MSDSAVLEVPPIVPGNRPGTFSPKSGQNASRKRWDASPGQTINPLDPFVVRRLKRARTEWTRLERLIRETSDALDLDRLTRAMERVVGIYCKLAGIPDPGSLRPVERQRRGRGRAPVDIS